MTNIIQQELVLNTHFLTRVIFSRICSMIWNETSSKLISKTVQQQKTTLKCSLRMLRLVKTGLQRFNFKLLHLKYIDWNFFIFKIEPLILQKNCLISQKFNSWFSKLNRIRILRINQKRSFLITLCPSQSLPKLRKTIFFCFNQ